MYVLRIFWEKTQKEYGKRYVYVFAESKQMSPTRLHYFSTNDAKTQKQTAFRFNQSTIPSQIVLCEFLLINILQQRPIVLNEYPPPPSFCPSHIIFVKRHSINQSINQSTLFKHGKWLSKLVFRHAV